MSCKNIHFFQSRSVSTTEFSFEIGINFNCYGQYICQNNWVNNQFLNYKYERKKPNGNLNLVSLSLNLVKPQGDSKKRASILPSNRACPIPLFQF